MNNVLRTKNLQISHSVIENGFAFEILYADGIKSKFFREESQPIAIVITESLKISLRDIYRSMEWNEAKAYCEKLSTGGKKWRLPTLEDLKVIYENKEKLREIFKNLGIRNFVRSWYWSSAEAGDDKAYFLFFCDGSINSIDKSMDCHIRPVMC